MSERFLEGTISQVKEYKESGLPNIEGHFGLRDDQTYFIDEMSGPFYYGGKSKHEYDALSNIPGSSRGDPYEENFDASLSNPIYGASNTVQPASYTVYFIMRVR